MTSFLEMWEILTFPDLQHSTCLTLYTEDKDRPRAEGIKCMPYWWQSINVIQFHIPCYIHTMIGFKEMSYIVSYSERYCFLSARMFGDELVNIVHLIYKIALLIFYIYM